MSVAAFLFSITLATIDAASISGSFQRCMTCACGSGSQNYAHCFNDSILNNMTCERWSRCLTCKVNTTSCITCPPGYWGPACSETSNEHPLRKRQDNPDLLIHPRYPRQSGSGKHSQTRCENHGTIPNGRIFVLLPFENTSELSEDDMDFDFPYGTSLKYSCEDGFVLIGKDTLRCGSDSYWTESIPECVPDNKPTAKETCRHPGVDVNGRINSPLMDSRRFPAGIELTFACNDGFELEGETVLICLRNGQWTSLPPKCRRNPTGGVTELPCRHPGMVINSVYNGDLNKSIFPVGTAVTFRCIEGAQRRGPMTIFCERNGMWSESPPACELRRY